MNTSSHFYRRVAVLLLLGGFGLVSPPAWGQTLSWDGPASFAFLNGARPSATFASEPPSGPVSRAPRLRLFCIAPGFCADPLGMQEEDCPLPGVPTMPGLNLAASDDADSGPELVHVGMGSDNPYFDLRRPGDPGGIGYYRVNTQVSLLDSPTTACTLNVQAVTPGGIQFAGVPDGPTVLSPAFSVFHAVNDRLAVQGFVCKNVPVSGSDGTGFLQRHLQYGMALQRPLLADGPEGWRNLFFSVGALGQLQPQHDALRLVPNYDVLPGLQWHVNDNWWVSSAVLVPLGPVRSAPGQWQLTCSLQF